MNRCECTHDLADHFEGACQVATCPCASYRPRVGGYSFKYQGVKIRCDTVEELDAFLAFREERTTSADLTQAEEVLRRLYETLPKCDDCKRAATKAFKRGEGRWCDRHAPEGCPDYPRAAALRHAERLLGPAGPSSAPPPSEEEQRLKAGGR